LGCSCFRNILIPTHILQITFSRQAARRTDKHKILTITIKYRYYPETSNFSSCDEACKDLELSASYNPISGVLTCIFVLQSSVHLLKSSVLTADRMTSYLYRSLVV
jgi:hypothetical protein